MAFLKFRRKRAAAPADTSRGQEPKKTIHRASPVAMEVKLLAMEALEAGLTAPEIGDLLGLSASTVHNWRAAYAEGGVSGLSRKSSAKAIRQQCSLLEERILARRKAHPQRGVRRIRDDLRRQEGLAVSAEKVRTTVKEAGLGQPPPQAKRRAPGVRRFERACPNALWQIDIFTFPLKRMYQVYLVGILDDHSRYVTGWGLFRQQTADAVLEVTKGAIGQWGAPREILSDNGRQFVAWRGQTRFQKVLKQQGIGHVRSAPQHPMTLGKIERFWKTIWEEFLGEAVFASFADACQRIDHWIHYYNHQRPHQGIEGACPADRFYGLAEDVEEAIRQGCEENALRLALGGEPQPPLYLLGQLGDTDVRVVRRGDQIEVKVGDAVHETIHIGAPFTIGEDGSCGRGEASAEVEGSVGPGALPGDPDGAPGVGGRQSALPELRGEPADVVPGHGGGRSGVDGSPGAEEAGTEANAGEPAPGPGAEPVARPTREGAGSLEDEVRGGQELHRSGAATGAADWLEGRRGKKTPIPEQEDEPSTLDDSYWSGDDKQDGEPT